MRSLPLPNIDALLEPIGPDDPSGPWRESDEELEKAFYATRTLLLRARDLSQFGGRERDRGLDGREVAPRRPDWSSVLQACEDLLLHRTKDLQVAAWLCEGLCWRDGFLGLAAGLRFLELLVRRHWGGIHPHPRHADGASGWEFRLEPLLSLDRESGGRSVSLPVADLPLTRNEGFTFAQYAVAQKMVDRSPEEQKAWRAQGFPSLQQVADAIQRTGAPFYNALHEELEACLAALDALEEEVRARLSGEPDAAHVEFSLINTRKSLLECRRAVGSVRGAPPEDAKVADAPLAAPSLREEESMQSPHEGIGRREDAVRALDAVVAYYTTHEPQNPLLCVVEQAVRWARLPLPALMKQVISPGSALHAVITQGCSTDDVQPRSDKKPSPAKVEEQESRHDSPAQEPRTSLQGLQKFLGSQS